MNKIYIGNTEVANVGSSGGGQEFNPSDYVDTSTWNEHEKVIASALVELKGLEDQIEAFDADIQAQETALLAEVNTKANTSDVYTKTDIDRSDKIVAAALASLNERITTIESASEGSGSSFDPTDINSSISDISTRVSTIENDYLVADDISIFYTKSHIDSSYGIIDASLKSFDASALAFDASIRALASSGGGDMSNYATKSDISTFKPIVYTTKDDYDEDVSEGTIDPDSMYVITDLASTDELSNIVTIDDLNAEKARINASLDETADAIISAANTSCGYWKDQNVSQCQSQCNSAKNTAVSAVQSQQTTSVNAVNTAKNTAISEIDTKMAEMKSFEVLTEAEYAEITPDANTIYFITD